MALSSYRISADDRQAERTVPRLTGTSAGRPQLRVLLSLAPPDGTTRYVVQLVEGVPQEVSLLFFSWKTALLGRYDIFHVHWPEFLIRGHNAFAQLVNSSLFATLLIRLKLLNVPIVRTVHNLSPHEKGSRLERMLLDACDAQTKLFIRLNAATDLGNRQNAITILHGHYKDRFKAYFLPPKRPGCFLYFGLIRPYKGVEDLLSVFSKLKENELSLRVVGQPSAGLGELVSEACRTDPRVSSRLEFVEDEILVREIGQGEVVVLPYKEMHNSGALLVALSLGRPVVAPRSASNELIAEEVGAEWLFLYDGPLTCRVLEEALLKFRSLPADAAPNLKGRDWKLLGEAHYQAYLQASSGS